MPIAVDEKPSGLTIGGNSAQSSYIITGTTDGVAARDAMIAAAPASIGGIPRSLASCEVEEIAASTWLGTMRYARDGSSSSSVPPPETGDATYTFATGGGSQRITQSFQTISRTAPAGQTAPDFLGAIGATPSGVEGCDIVVPVYRFAETHYRTSASVDDAYKAALYALTGKVNNAVWRGYAAGEVLFMGVSGARRASGDDWELSFEFAASQNRTSLVVGNITVPAKKGWEYLWVRYEDVEDTTAKSLVKRPIAAYVERVYDTGNFSALAI